MKEALTAFVPFAEQEGENKLHTISLSIEHSTDITHQERICTRCKTLMTRTVTEHRFGWGDRERLECLVNNAPALRCSCRTVFGTDVALQIKEKARKIRDYVAFQNDEDFAELTTFLSPSEILKVQDFARASEQERAELLAKRDEYQLTASSASSQPKILS